MIKDRIKIPGLPEDINIRTESGCIEIFENFITQEAANNIIKVFEDANDTLSCPMTYSNARIGDAENSKDGGFYRSNLIMSIEPHGDCTCKIFEAYIYLHERFSKCVNFYQEKYQVEIGFDEGLQLLKYSPGNEYKPHMDYGKGFEHRILSGLILLNPNDYIGGGTYFNNFDINIKPTSPSIVLFPSNYAYMHRAKAVLDGTKYAIVTWLGPTWLRQERN